MPTTLIQTGADAAQAVDVRGRALVAAHAQIASILGSRLGARHAALLAQPQPVAGGGWAWSTDLPGSAQPASRLGADERAAVQARATALQAEIRALAEAMRGESASGHLVAQMVERALLQPPGDWLYAVGGQPVLVLWGHVAPGTAPPDVEAAPARTPPPAVAAAAAPAAAAAAPRPDAAAAAAAELAAAMAPPPEAPPPSAGGPVGPPSPPPRRWWLVALALVGLLLIVLFGLQRCASAGDAEADLAAQISAAEERNRALQAELQRKQAPQLQCVADPPAPAAPAASAPEPPASAPEPPPDPLAPLRKRIAEAQRCEDLMRLFKQDAELRTKPAAELRKGVLDTLQKRCKDTLISEAKNLCPGERPAQVVPEFVIVFDTSPSMAYSLSKSDAEIMAAERANRRDLVTQDPQRIAPARDAAVDVARRVPRDMSVGLVKVETCTSGARPMGFYGPAQRPSLVDQLRSAQPHPFGPGAGTPLADGIGKAADMVDGVNREATILIISDGEESCRGDPCAVARALAARKPKLKINVLDITGTGAGNCVAGATGGQVFTARNPKEVIDAMRKATQEVMGPARCTAR